MDITKIYDLLNRLGVTGTYIGYYQVAYAVKLAVEDPEQLYLLTKRMYPDVAKHFHTTASAVERNIRTIITTVWKRNPYYLEEIARYRLRRKPTSGQFLSILATHFPQNDGNVFRPGA